MLIYFSFHYIYPMFYLGDIRSFRNGYLDHPGKFPPLRNPFLKITRLKWISDEKGKDPMGPESHEVFNWTWQMPERPSIAI